MSRTKQRARKSAGNLNQANKKKNNGQGGKPMAPSSPVSPKDGDPLSLRKFETPTAWRVKRGRVSSDDDDEDSDGGAEAIDAKPPRKKVKKEVTLPGLVLSDSALANSKKQAAAEDDDDSTAPIDALEKALQTPASTKKQVHFGHASWFQSSDSSAYDSEDSEHEGRGAKIPMAQKSVLNASNAPSVETKVPARRTISLNGEQERSIIATAQKEAESDDDSDGSSAAGVVIKVDHHPNDPPATETKPELRKTRRQQRREADIARDEEAEEDSKALRRSRRKVAIKAAAKAHAKAQYSLPCPENSKAHRRRERRKAAGLPKDMLDDPTFKEYLKEEMVKAKGKREQAIKDAMKSCKKQESAPPTGLDSHMLMIQHGMRDWSAERRRDHVEKSLLKVAVTKLHHFQDLDLVKTGLQKILLEIENRKYRLDGSENRSLFKEKKDRTRKKKERKAKTKIKKQDSKIKQEKTKIKKEKVNIKQEPKD